MTSINDLTPEQKTMLIHSKKRYEEIIEQINLFGHIFSSHLNQQHDSQLDYLYHDIVSRIAQNLYCLTFVPPQDATVVATRLILRSVFSDLILALALLCSNKSDAERICIALSLQSDKKQRSAFLHEQSLAENIPAMGLDSNSIKQVIEFLDKEIQKKESILKSKKAKVPNTTISSFANIIGNSQNSDIPGVLKELLHSSFLRLSQTEHYSISGRQMSKFNRDEIFFFSTYSDWLAVAVHCLLKALVAEYGITEFEPKQPNNPSNIK